jgi:hypothetical protein
MPYGDAGPRSIHEAISEDKDMQATTLLAAAALALLIPAATIADTHPSALGEPAIGPPGSLASGLPGPLLRIDGAAHYWEITSVGPGSLVVSDPGPSGASGRDVWILAPAALADLPIDPRLEQEWRWPASDIQGWIAVYGRGIASSRPERTTIAGHAALTFDVYAGVEPVDFATTAAGETFRFEPGADYRVWWVAHDIQPIVAVARSPHGAHSTITQAQQLLAGLAIDLAS